MNLMCKIMKLNKYSWLVALPMVFTACQEDMLVENSMQQTEGVYTLKASMPDNGLGSRAQIVIGGESTEKESFYWNEGDVFYMYAHGEENGGEYPFTISSEYSEDNPSSIANFTSNQSVRGNTFVAFYPNCSPEFGGNGWDYNYSNGNYTASLENSFVLTDEGEDAAWREFFSRNMMMYAKGNLGATGADTEVNFEHLCGLIRITFTDNTTDGTTLKAVKLNGSWGKGVVVSSSTGDVVPLEENNDNLELKFELPYAFPIEKGKSKDFYMFFFPPTGSDINPLTQISVAYHLDCDFNPIYEDVTPSTYNGNDFSVEGFEAGNCYWFNITRDGNGLQWTKNYKEQEVVEEKMVEVSGDNYIFKNKVFASLLVSQCAEQGFSSYGEGYAAISIADAEKLPTLSINADEVGQSVYVGDLNEELACFPALEELRVDKIGLTSINLSKNTSLKILSCTMNSLSELDLTSNTELTEVVCGRNQITSLDLSKNTKLETFASTAAYGEYYLYHNNYFSEIDFTHNTNLQRINLSNNGLITKLDVSMLTNLEGLDVSCLPLATLDLSKNTKLQSLTCGEMENLTSLDLSNNTELETLSCYWNVFENLDLSKNLKLTTLYYNVQYMVETEKKIDISKNVNIETLTYSNTDVESLDLSHLTKLKELVCTDNANLTELTLPASTNFESLECYSNKLTTLDLSKHTSLRSIKCYDNQLTTLDISALSNLSNEGNWGVEVGNQKDKSIEYNYTDRTLNLTLTSAQKDLWDTSWNVSDKNGNIEFNELTDNTN